MLIPQFFAKCRINCLNDIESWKLFVLFSHWLIIMYFWSGLLPEYSMECHCSRHICEESEKEEESCQVGHRGDGTKDVSVSTGKN